MQIKAGQDEDTALVPYATFESVVVPWLVQHEKALKPAGFHALMRAFKAFDPEEKGWIDSQMLKTTLTTKVIARPSAVQLVRTRVDAALCAHPRAHISDVTWLCAGRCAVGR